MSLQIHGELYQSWCPNITLKLKFGCCEKRLFVLMRKPIVNACAVLVANKYFSKVVVIFFYF